MRTAITSASGARSICSSVIGPLAGLWIRSTRAPFGCQLLTSQPSGGRCVFQPSSSKAASAVSTSSGRMRKSTSCSLRGPSARPRGEAAAEHERDLHALEDGDGVPHGLDQLLEAGFRHRRVVSGLSNRAT